MLRSTRAQLGSRWWVVYEASFALWSIQATSRSRGIRIERPILIDGISPLFAKSKTFARLSDNSFAASAASSSSGKSRGGDALVAGLRSGCSDRVSMSWCNVVTTSSLALPLKVGEPDGPGSPTPPPGRCRTSKLSRWLGEEPLMRRGFLRL